MNAAGKVAQLLRRRRMAGWLAEQPGLQRQGLVGADDIFSRPAPRHIKRLLARKKCRYFTGR
jgi:hypothetical protein